MIAYVMAAASLFAPQAVPSQPRVSCGAQPPSVVGRSPSGVAQVNNLGLISVGARVFSVRPMPPDNVQYGLRTEVTVYQLAADGTRTVVPSTVNASGGGGDLQSEYASSSLDIPVDAAERDAAGREYLAYLTRVAAESSNETERAMMATLQKTPPEVFARIFQQHRLGRFEMECRVLDRDRVIGVGRGELEVLFKGRFFDQDAFRKK